MSYPPSVSGWVCVFRNSKDSEWEVDDRTFDTVRNDSIDKARHEWCYGYDNERIQGIAKCVRAEIRTVDLKP